MGLTTREKRGCLTTRNAVSPMVAKRLQSQAPRPTSGQTILPVTSSSLAVTALRHTSEPEALTDSIPVGATTSGPLTRAFFVAWGGCLPRCLLLFHQCVEDWDREFTVVDLSFVG